METIGLSDFLKGHRSGVILTIVISISVPILIGLEKWLILLGPLLLLVFLFTLFNFGFSLYVLILTMFLGDYLIFEGHLSLSFLVMEVVLLSFLTKGLVSGKISISATPLDKTILIFIVAIALSLVNAVYPFSAAREYLWHVNLFILFYVVASSVRSISLKNLISFLVLLAVLHSIPPLIRSISSSGVGRYFGIAGTYGADLSVVALLFCVPFFLFEERFRYKMLWGIAILILLAAFLIHKTRGAIIGVTVTYILMNMIFFRKSIELRLRFVLRNMVISFLTITSVIILMFYKLPTLSAGFKYHLYYSVQPIDTIQIRFILWDLALKFFSKNPILGIGLGQFSKLSTLNLEPKYQPFYLAIAGLGPHNLFLGYLCETGIIGALGFLYFLFYVLKLSWSKYKISTTPDDLKLSGALLGAFFYIATNSLYSGRWNTGPTGILLAFILAFIVIFKPNLSK